MAKDDENCPACNDNPHPMGEPLPGNEHVTVRPYTPPTEAELEFTRNFYANIRAREHGSHTERVLSHAKTPSPERFSGAPPIHAGTRRMDVPPAAVTHPIEPNGVLPDFDSSMPSQLTMPWFGIPQEAPTVGGEAVRDPGVELIAVQPPPPVLVVLKTEGEASGAAWPRPFRDDLARCTEEWDYDIGVEYRTPLGEGSFIFESPLFERARDAHQVKESAPFTAELNAVAQMRAEAEAAGYADTLRSLPIVATKSNDRAHSWRNDLRKLVQEQLDNLALSDPCPERCPIRDFFAIVGWDAETHSVIATRIATTSEVKYQMVDGILDGYYKVVWTIRFSFEAVYAVMVYCRFRCSAEDF
jgi:hypothetical protein